jgi:flagellar basal body-associated protein FliL
MLISILGIIMIVTTVAIVAYVGISMVSHGIASNVESGTQNDKLLSLRSAYDSLNTNLENKKSTSYNSSSGNLNQNYINAVSALNVAKSAIDNFNSGIYSNKDSSNMDNLSKTAEEKLNIASDMINKL